MMRSHCRFSAVALYFAAADDDDVGCAVVRGCWIRKCNAWCGLLLVLFAEETFRTQWMRRRMILECLLMHDAWNPSNPRPRE